MKILGVSDIHSKYQRLIDYLKRSHVDLIILTGDITDFGPADLAEDILNEISSFNIPVLAIPGNCDPVDIYNKIDNSNAINIHGRSVIIRNMGIGGFGGSNRTPFNTPLEFEEVQIYGEARKVMEEIKDQRVTLFITHAPPYGTKTDLLPSGDHVGSRAFRKIIEEFQPSINICGHIHEAKALDKIGKTTIINPGELSEGSACLVEVDDSDEDDIKVDSRIIDL